MLHSSESRRRVQRDRRAIFKTVNSATRDPRRLRVVVDRFTRMPASPGPGAGAGRRRQVQIGRDADRADRWRNPPSPLATGRRSIRTRAHAPHPARLFPHGRRCAGAPPAADSGPHARGICRLGRGGTARTSGHRRPDALFQSRAVESVPAERRSRQAPPQRDAGRGRTAPRRRPTRITAKCATRRWRPANTAWPRAACA